MREDNVDIECFNKLIWQKQCEYSQKVLSYLKKLQFGNTCCEELEELKNYRRVLLILNCYDTRDISSTTRDIPSNARDISYNTINISSNTTDYNTISYIEIKKLLINLNF